MTGEQFSMVVYRGKDESKNKNKQRNKLKFEELLTLGQVEME